MARRSPTIYWDIYEEHLREAAFLWELWHSAMQSASYNLAEVMRGPEQRLHAHLDALLIAPRPVHERLLLGALEDADPFTLSAAAWVLSSIEAGSFAPALRQHLQARTGAARGALARAIGLSSAPAPLQLISELWPEADAALRASMLDIAATRDSGQLGGDILQHSLESEDPTLRAAAARAVRFTPDRALSPLVQRALDSDDTGVRYEAIVTGYTLGVPGSWEALKAEKMLSAEDSRARRLLALFALHPERRQREPLYAALTSPRRRDALWALGFVGDVESADLLVEALHDEADARVAADSFTAVTGVTLRGALLRAPAPTPEQDPDAPLRSPDPSDELPQPNAQALTDWWKRARAGLAERQRYVYGVPDQPASLLRAMLRCGMWRSDIFDLWHARRSRGALPLGSRRWALQQHARITAELGREPN